MLLDMNVLVLWLFSLLQDYQLNMKQSKEKRHHSWKNTRWKAACFFIIILHLQYIAHVNSHIHMHITYTTYIIQDNRVSKIYILRPNQDQLRKMELQGLRLGIEPAILDLRSQPTELQKPLPWAWVQVLCIYNI